MNSIDEIVVTYVTNCIWMTCMVALVTTVFSRTLRNAPSSYRHTLWVVALLFAVLLPLGGLQQNNQPRLGSIRAATVTSPAETSIGKNPWAVWLRFHPRGKPVTFGALGVKIVSLLYLGFVLFRGIRLYHGWRALKTVLQNSREPQITTTVRTLAEQGYSRLKMKPVRILLSDDGKGPATLGIRNPIVILPDWLVADGSKEKVSSVLGHELAHIRRHDFFLNLVYEICLLPISFHPAAALIKTRIDQTRELAGDEIAAEHLSTPAQYAHSILSIAESMAANQLAMAAGYALGLFDPNTMEDRVMNLLAIANRTSKIWARTSAIGAAAVLTAACLGAAGFAIQVNQPHKMNSDLQMFVGTWEAKFKGKVFQTIKLTKDHETLSGTVSHGNIGVDPKTGELSDVEVLDGKDAIVDTKLKNRKLLITEADATQFEMKITGTDQAELQIVIPPEYVDKVPAVKPWKLTRVKSGD